MAGYACLGGGIQLTHSYIILVAKCTGGWKPVKISWGRLFSGLMYQSGESPARLGEHGRRKWLRLSYVHPNEKALAFAKALKILARPAGFAHILRAAVGLAGPTLQILPRAKQLARSGANINRKRHPKVAF